MIVRAFRDSDWVEWLRMSVALFVGVGADDLEQGMLAWRAREDTSVFIAERDDGCVAGFVEVGSRLYADGCESSPVGYIEAWYVDPDVRLRGLGRALLVAAEQWARGRGYREMASDALLENDVSHIAHTRSGYQEVARVIQYRKAL